MTKITMKIDGMMCGMCETHVNDIIRKAFTIKKVSSSHKKGEIVILSENDILEEQLRSAIESTGYHVLSISKEEYKKKSFLNFHK